ncbi:MAG TPA: MFS transporter, partial [Armatimonadota bacterium]|nr:MFS transporter [Armatimonadota bacterium]
SMTHTSPPPPGPTAAPRNPLAAAFGILFAYPVLIPLGLVTLCAQLTYSGVNNVTMHQYIKILGATSQNDGIILGWVGSMFLLSETFLRVPFGWLSDRVGRAKLVILALLLSAPSFFISSTVAHYRWLFPLRWWDGMMAAALWPSVFALIGDTVPARARANAMGAINMMYMLALFAGGALAGVLLDRSGSPRIFFVVGSAVMALGGLVALTVFRARPQLAAPHPDVHGEDEARAALPPLRHLPLLVITFVQNFAILILAQLLFDYVRHDLGFTLKQIGLLVGAPVVGIALFALPLSRVGDIVGKVAVVRAAFTAVAIALWAFAFNTSLLGLSIITAVIGVAFAMGIPAWLAIITSLSGRTSRGVTFAAYGTVQGLAAVCGPIVGGYIWNTLGHAAIFMVSAAAITLGALLAWTALPGHLKSSSSSYSSSYSYSKKP